MNRPKKPSHATVPLRCTARRALMRECRATWFPTPSKWKTMVAFPSCRDSHYFPIPPHPSPALRAQCCPWSSQLRNIVHREYALLYVDCKRYRKLKNDLFCVNFVYGLKKKHIYRTINFSYWFLYEGSSANESFLLTFERETIWSTFNNWKLKRIP